MVSQIRVRFPNDVIRAFRKKLEIFKNLPKLFCIKFLLCRPNEISIKKLDSRAPPPSEWPKIYLNYTFYSKSNSNSLWLFFRFLFFVSGRKLEVNRNSFQNDFFPKWIFFQNGFFFHKKLFFKMKVFFNFQK